MKSLDFVKIPLKFLLTEGLMMRDHTIRTNIIFPFIVCNTLINTIGQSNCLLTSIREDKSLTSAANFVFTLLYMLSIFSKVFSILQKREQFRILLDELDDIMPQSKHERKDYRVDEFLKLATRMSAIFAIIQIGSIKYMSFSSNVISYLAPRPENETWHAVLPYGDDYPFYQETRISFPILFLIQVWQGYICIGIIYAVNFVTFGILVQICMHYEHLAWKIRTFNCSENDNIRNNEHLIWCVSKHNHLNRLMVQLNEIFSVATLVNVLTGSLILVIFCFIGSNLASPNDLIQYFMAAGSTVLELYVMCMYSQKMRDCSAAIGESAYESEWFSKSIAYKKGVVSMIQRSHRIISLSAFKFGELSKELFTEILKMSYRLLTLLNNVQK